MIKSRKSFDKSQSPCIGSISPLVVIAQYPVPSDLVDVPDKRRGFGGLSESGMVILKATLKE